jgi:DNA-directed RNA polymerase specialized sigma24 family protein
MEDEALVGQILRGNQEAFRLLVLRYQRPLFRFLGLLGFDGASCEDLAQQTFLSAFRALADFDPGRARFSTWLFTIAKRHASHERERAARCRWSTSRPSLARSGSRRTEVKACAGSGSARCCDEI